MVEFLLQIIDNLDVAFSVLLNRALAATPVILAACLYRVLLRKAPKWSRILVWLLAGLRLALPVSVKSAWSLVPSETVLDYKTAQYAAKPELTSGIASFNSAVNPVFGEHFAANPQGSVNPLQVWMHIAGGIWALGVLVLLVLALVSFWKVRRRVSASIEHHGRAVIEIAACVFEARVVRACHRVAAEICKAIFLGQREERLTNDALRAAAVDDHGLCSNIGRHVANIIDRSLRVDGDEDEIARADILLR